MRGTVSDGTAGWRHRRSALVIGVLWVALCALALTAGQGRAQQARRPAGAAPTRAQADITRSAPGGDVWSGRWTRRRVSDSDLTSVSCPSSSFCMALADVPGDHGGHAYAFTYSDHKWSRGRKIDPYTYQDSLSCSSPSFCMVVDSIPGIAPEGYKGGYAFTYSHGRWSRGRKIDHDSSLYSVSCASRRFCMAVDYPSGSAFTYSDGRWSRGRRIDRKGSLISVSCPSASFCLAVDQPRRIFRDTAYYLTYTDGRWSAARKMVLRGDAFPLVGAVSCASPSFCAALDDSGHAYMYSGHWSTGRLIDTSDELSSVSCARPSSCVAVGGSYADIFSGGRWLRKDRLNRHLGLVSVSCPTPSYCVALADYAHSYAYTYRS